MTTETTEATGTKGAPATAETEAETAGAAEITGSRTPIGTASVPAAVLVVQHEEDAGAGLVGERLARAGLRLDVVRAWEGQALPADLRGHAGLLVLGGAVNCEDDEAAPWLPGVRALVREALTEEVPLLGICLGGQIVAHALGGSVATRPQGPELGAVPLRRLPAATEDPVLGGVPDGSLAAQWHWDDVDRLPPGAVPLLTGDDCPYQAFRVGSACWAVQFHPEAGGNTVAEWAAEDGERLRESGTDPEALVTAVRDAEPELRTVWGAVADAWGAVVRAHADARRWRPLV
ncbi:type 1 glutamine amidotransferase [Streptomyces sp. NPDC006553]|uniref:type 1 glutamine amidotransferase n=1 Tax=unclassified Streptomyces TaxID=2593676 RepID=UPI002250B59D|nr:type 1 glutamine amidotransferase [Streptomyces sp. NBC_00233]MCX5231656.1 type 1 glutamine amidotransferase [Streptomyces sp. NBC_00233]